MTRSAKRRSAAETILRSVRGLTPTPKTTSRLRRRVPQVRPSFGLTWAFDDPVLSESRATSTSGTSRRNTVQPLNSLSRSRRPCTSRRICTPSFSTQYTITYSPTTRLLYAGPKSLSRERPRYGKRASARNPQRRWGRESRSLARRGGLVMTIHKDCHLIAQLSVEVIEIGCGAWGKSVRH